MFLYQILACTIYAKKQNIIKNNKFKISAPTWNEMDHVLYQIFKIISNNYFKTHENVIDNPLIRIYVNEIGNRIIFGVETEYYLEILIPETMKFHK